MKNHPARYLNVALGFWLLVSTFLWAHSSAQFVVTWLTGVAMTFFGLIALGIPRFEIVNVVLGAWLVVSAFALPRIGAATNRNSVIVGLLVVILGFVGSERSLVHHRPAHAAV
jgi:hypothetical protein